MKYDINYITEVCSAIRKACKENSLNGFLNVKLEDLRQLTTYIKCLELYKKENQYIRNINKDTVYQLRTELNSYKLKIKTEEDINLSLKSEITKLKQKIASMELRNDFKLLDDYKTVCANENTL